MDVSKNRGIPKWMVKIIENPIKMDDLGIGNTHIEVRTNLHFHQKLNGTKGPQKGTPDQASCEVQSYDRYSLRVCSGSVSSVGPGDFLDHWDF